MKNFLSLVALAFCLSACASTVPEIVKSPLRAPPLLKSVVADKNDRTGLDGVWLDWGDYKETLEFFDHTRNVKKAGW